MIIWIVYVDLIGVSKIVAENLAEYLEETFDVNVANAEKITPSIVMEESPDILIYGTFINNRVLNSKIRDWILEIYHLPLPSKTNTQEIFTFGVIHKDTDINEIWTKNLSKVYSPNITAKKSLKIKIDNLKSQNKLEIQKSVKNYANYIINQIKERNKRIVK
ncbi:MAG: hypothetical protein GF317_10665 [Candidatus Lokiarchaeota archaeon]|nr:hypothetical protein [Candidatus Lokiarchaeota archaeon]MBD3200123.1 hypothetical protein [Candidatus Lokiarchaeota archaeon]